MRKILGITGIALALGLSLFGCDSTTPPAKTSTVGTATPTGGGTSTAKGGTPSTMAPTPEMNPGYKGGIGTKVR